MNTSAWPWERYGGSFVWLDTVEVGARRATLPGACCDDPQPKLVGDCGRGCCDDYVCLRCSRRWRYEWPD